MESVSAMEGLISVAGIPNTSAKCMAIAARLPPMSGDPSTRLMVPSGLTLATALAGPVPLNQAPAAMPLPWLGPSSGVAKWGAAGQLEGPQPCRCGRRSAQRPVVCLPWRR